MLSGVKGQVSVRRGGACGPGGQTFRPGAAAGPGADQNQLQGRLRPQGTQPVRGEELPETAENRVQGRPWTLHWSHLDPSRPGGCWFEGFEAVGLYRDTP